MSFFDNMSIRSKVILAFSAVLILTALLGVFAILRINVLAFDSASREANILQIEPLGVMSMDAQKMVAVTALAAGDPNQANASATLAALPAVQAQYTAQWNAYEPTMDSGRESTDGNGFNTVYGQLNTTLSSAAADITTGDHLSAALLLTQKVPSEIQAFANDINADSPIRICA